jgi:diguanylate cyclase (GGDEF)-like protein
MRHFLLCILLLAVLTVAGPVVAAAPRDGWGGWRTTRFLTLDATSGLPHATTTAIVQGSDALMWIGTRGGLARYDGQRLKVFRQVSRDRTSLPDNYIRALHALPRGGMLVGTNVGGAVRFDPVSNAFVALQGAAGVGMGTRILAITSDGQDGALIASDHGVFRYDARHDRVVSLVVPGGDLAEGAFTVHRDADGTIYAGGDKGLFVRRPHDRAFSRVATPAFGDVWAIQRGAYGRLWIGTGSHGIFVQLRDGRFVQPRVLAGDAPLVGHRTIRAFARQRDGTIWAATDGMGVLRIRTDHGVTVDAMRNIPANHASLGGDTVRDVTIDRTGRLWAATDVGASQTDPTLDAIFTITNAMPDPRQSLGDRNVRGVMVDSRDRIWVGLSNGMIDRIDRAAGTVRHFRLNGRHAGQDVKAFLELPGGMVLVGARGIVAIDPVTFAERSLAVPLPDDLPVIALARSGHLLLIGTYKGLFTWDERTRRLAHYRHVDGDATAIANNEVINIVDMGDGQPWIATPGGLSRFDPATGRFANYRNDPADPASLPQNYTGSIVQSAGALWVGTYGGVARGTQSSHGLRFRAITEAEGLANDNVAAVLADRRGRVWTTGASGISVLDPQGRGVRVVSQRDGLPSDAYNQRVAAMTRDGDLLFGGTGGLLVLRPDRMLAARPNGSLTLAPTDIEQDGRVLPFGPLVGQRAIRVDGHALRVAFALTDYAAPQEIRYRYRLVGFDTDWVGLPESVPATAIYTNLPGGEYVLELQAHIPGVHPRVVTTAIDMVVTRAWHERWYVRLAMAIIALTAVVGIVQLRTMVLRQRTRALERTIEQRTGELRAANVTLSQLASTDSLTGLANRRTLLARLEAARETAMRSGRGYAVAMLDIDHFKRVNDTYGHHTGDLVVQAVAARIAGGVRAVDCVARYGGEELAILFADSGIADAAAITERLRQVVARAVTDVDGARISVTLSAGIAAATGGEPPAAVLHRADLAMYRAKRAGRNRIELADDRDLADLNEPVGV